MIRCPKCNGKLQNIISREYWGAEEIHCYYCNQRLTKPVLKSLVTAEDCFACQDGDLESVTFDPACECDECMRADCILAGSDIISDFGLEQDEEGNWGYLEDIDREGY